MTEVFKILFWTLMVEIGLKSTVKHLTQFLLFFDTQQWPSLEGFFSLKCNKIPLPSILFSNGILLLIVNLKKQTAQESLYTYNEMLLKEH